MSTSSRASALLRAAPSRTQCLPQTAALAGSIHSSASKHQDVSIPLPTSPVRGPYVSSTYERSPTSAMASLPLSQILRTYLITSVSSSPKLLDASSSLLRRLIDSDNSLLSLDKNPVLRAVLWETFYKQFCAGETAEQIDQTCDALRQQGYAGVILEYALEVLKDAEGSSEAQDIATWKEGLLKSVEVAAPGDFVALKWSGMGTAAWRRLEMKQDPSPAMYDAMIAVCEAAVAKNIALLPSAEETCTLDGYFHWTMMMQKRFNRGGKSTMYTTYQAYLRQTPANLTKHLEDARKDGITLGVKMVRGAYLATEPRHLIYPTIEGTHAAFDGIADALVHRRFNSVLSSEMRDMPDLSVVLATHNAESVRKAKQARQTQHHAGKQLTPLCFAQLQGMADEVSCSLLAQGHESPDTVVEKVYKFTTWGTMTQCLNYLLRRAAENKDAASRTADSRLAMQHEIWRRMTGAFNTAP